jgi:ABC-type multidrug transport system ATPase subunit
MTVAEHIRTAARIKGLGRAETEAETERLSRALSLGDKLAKTAGSLSMGSRRQAALALALLGSPRRVVLDEPASSLDPAEARKLSGLLQNLDAGVTLVVSSHILPEVASLTDRAAFLRDGLLAGAGAWPSLPGGASAPEEAYFSLVGP